MDQIKKTLLIVEDEKKLLHALVQEFEQENFNVLQATDGEVGLKLALEKHPDIILLDIIMPKMDGMTLLDNLRKDNWGKDVPVIILTNLTDAKKAAESAAEGVYDYLVKTDWSLEDIVRAVKVKLEEK